MLHGQDLVENVYKFQSGTQKTLKKLFIMPCLKLTMLLID